MSHNENIRLDSTEASTTDNIGQCPSFRFWLIFVYSKVIICFLNHLLVEQRLIEFKVLIFQSFNRLVFVKPSTNICTKKIGTSYMHKRAYENLKYEMETLVSNLLNTIDLKQFFKFYVCKK